MTEQLSSEPTRPGMRWYVLRVASNKEDQVCEALTRKVKIEGLESRVARVLVPTLKEKKFKGGVLKFIERKLYPGYVFVEMACEPDGSMNEQVWFTVKETTGVGDFIGANNKPKPMPDHEVGAMLAACEKPDESALAAVQFQKGDLVKITEGPFEGYEGEVDSMDERRGLVTVVVMVFGRATQLDVEYWQLERATAEQPVKE